MEKSIVNEEEKFGNIGSGVCRLHTFNQRPRWSLVVTMPDIRPPFSMTSRPPTQENPQASEGLFRVRVGNNFFAARSQPRRSPRRWLRWSIVSIWIPMTTHLGFWWRHSFYFDDVIPWILMTLYLGFWWRHKLNSNDDVTLLILITSHLWFWWRHTSDLMTFDFDAVATF